jgi:hypothetical protein
MGIVFLAIGLLPNAAQAEWETIIPSDSLTPANFDTYWNWFYSWGDTHNGAAKMYIEQVTLDASGTATIVAETPDPESEWKYRSGAFHSKLEGVCNECYPEWDFKGEFRAPTVKGSWPAFWYTGTWNWPPEIDILEFKGTVTNWFNTYDGGWETKRVRITDAPDVWHEYRCHITQLNATDVTVEFYLDGALKATHTGSNFVGEPMEVIVNMQMEGSSGTPGPTAPTYYYARNIVVQRDAVPLTGPPAAPTNLATGVGDTKVDLDWDNNSECDFSHYNLKRSTTPGGPYSQIATDLTEPSFSDMGLTNGITYYYVVTAVDYDLNESANSNEASATPVTMYPVTVDNYSFELPGTVKQNNWTNVPNWSSDSTAADSGVESDYPTTDGIWRGFLLSDDPSVWNLTGHTISAGEQFYLTIDASITGVDNFKISLYYDDVGSRVEVASKTFQTTADYVEYSVSFDADDVPASIGNAIGIELDNADSYSWQTWVAFDNVRLGSSIDSGNSYCGDETCDPGEDQCNCSDDCGTPPSTETNCDDGIDEDCDTYTDCDDSDCDGISPCPTCGDDTCDPGEDQCNCPDDCGTPPSTETDCDDGIDNDCGGGIDCDDSDCLGDPACQVSGTIFADDFESGSYAAGGWIVTNAQVSTQAPYTGVYGSKHQKYAVIEKAVSTAGRTGISVEYDRITLNYDPEDFFEVEWFDGTDWNLLEATQDTSWSHASFALPSGADDNSAFRIRFTGNANKPTDKAFLDNVEILD